MTPTREQLATEAVRLAREITNSWACVARSKRDTGYIYACHKKLDELAACLAAPPPEPQAMPPIEVGDVARLDGFGLVTVNRPEEAGVLSLGSDGLVAVYKPVWTREPRR